MIRRLLVSCYLIGTFFTFQQSVVSYETERKCENGLNNTLCAGSTIVPQLSNANGALKLAVFQSDNNQTVLDVRYVTSNQSESSDEHDEAGRTFGVRRRMQLLLWLPLSFKIGVIVTLLLVVTTIVVKTLGIGIVILFLLLTNSFGHGKPWGFGLQRTADLTDANRNVHIHVHSLPPTEHQPYVEPWHGSSSTSTVYYSS